MSGSCASGILYVQCIRRCLFDLSSGIVNFRKLFSQDKTEKIKYCISITYVVRSGLDRTHQVLVE